MGNNFFNNHPILGSIFDFNRDGNMNLGEASAMSAFGAMYAAEAMQATEEAEREANSFYDDLETDAGEEKKKAKKKSRDDYWDAPWEKELDKIDTYDRDEVFEAIINDELGMYGTEELVYEALDHGVEFDADEIEEIVEHISDKDLKKQLWRSLDDDI